MSSSGFTAHWQAIVLPMAVSQTWMTSVTRNLLIDHYRRTKRDRITDSLDDKMPVVENKESAGRRPDEQALLGELSARCNRRSRGFRRNCAKR